MKLTTLIIISLLSTTPATLLAKSKSSQPKLKGCEKTKSIKQCDCYKEHLEFYENKMRNGYTAGEYNELESKRRYFRDKTMQCK